MKMSLEGVSGNDIPIANISVGTLVQIRSSGAVCLRTRQGLLYLKNADHYLEGTISTLLVSLLPKGTVVKLEAD
jgi:hypothetical protein